MIGKLIKDKNGKTIKIEKEFFSQGYIFKNEDAYNNRKDETCYVPELSDFEYTGNNILEMCQGRQDVANDVFFSLDWQHPESLLDDWVATNELVICEKCNYLIDYQGGAREKKCPKCGWEVVI